MANTPWEIPLIKLLILLKNSGKIYFKMKKKKRTKIRIKINVVILVELSLSDIRFKIKSFFKIIATQIIPKAQTKSAIRSAIMVPKVLSNGIFSYLDIIVALATSPALGTVKLIRYAENTAKKLFKKEIL